MKAGSKRVAKTKYVCRGGPMDNHVLYLCGRSTAYMDFNGVSGRYIKRGLSGNDLTWEPK